MKRISFLIALVLAIISYATTQAIYSAPLTDPRAQLPKDLDQTYVGASVGYTDIPYSNLDLINGFQANNFNNPDVGLGVFVGHFFNRYFATQVSLMRPIEWAYANGVTASDDWHSIWVSVFGITMRPTLPLTDHLSLYALAGLGIVSRHGFSIGNTSAIPSTDLITLMTGGGVTYAINSNWHLDFGLQDAIGREGNQQPNILYAFGGFYYLLEPVKIKSHYKHDYIFHKNLIQAGSFSTNVFNPDINKYFTIGYLPVFWTGDIQAQNGEWLMYNRNIFHTHKIFSLDIGTSIADYDSALNNTSFQTISVFPEIRLWFYRGPLVDWYFNYAVAGPTYITRKTIDNINSGGNFTFQDLMGVGFFLGKNKNLNLDFKIAHYSNGNLLPTNPGIQIPLVVSVGYAFY